MKRQFKRVFALVVTLVTMVSLFSFQASAAGGSISISEPSVTVGDTVTVTVTAASDSDIAMFKAILTYDTSLLEYVSGSGDGTVSGGAGSVELAYYSTASTNEVSYSLNFKAKATGDAKIETTSGVIVNADEESFTPHMGTSTITIHSPGQASSEARLGSLKIGSASLSPAFSPDVFDYSATVPAGTEQLRVSLSLMGSNAKYSISDTKLNVGENTTIITVTAEDGTTETYTIHVTRPEGEGKPAEKPEDQGNAGDTRISVTVEGRTLYVGESLEGIAIPEGFELQMAQYGDREVPAAVGLVKPLTLFWLVDETGSGAFYVQDAESGAFYPYVNLTSGQKMFTVLPLANGVMPPEGYEASTISIGEDEYVCWRNSANPESEFVLIYAMNWDGVTGFYRYDTVEGTVQRCTEDQGMDTMYSPEHFAQLEQEMKEKLDANESALKQSNMLVLILVVVAAVELLAVIAVIVITKRRGAANSEDGYQGSRTGSSHHEKNDLE